MGRTLLEMAGRAGRRVRGLARQIPGGSAITGSLDAAAVAPVEFALRSALRRLARRQPEVFERLGAAGQSRILICPAGSPIAFLLQPSGVNGLVRLVDAGARTVCDARIEAPLGLLLRLLEGREDGDAVFFNSQLWIEGDTGIVLGLRNAIEAAEIRLGDLLPLPPGLRSLAEAVMPARQGLAS